jgi:hypothetical protein
MAWTPIDGRGVTIPQLREHVEKMSFSAWRPSFMVVHNTAAPTIAQWLSYPADKRIKNLEGYYKGLGWPSGPHAFVAPDLIWLFTPFNKKGTHSPSWNGTALGIEMVGDFSKEDDDSGHGLKVKMNTVALFAILHEKLGLNPQTIKLHKEDRATTHDCPGKDFEKGEFIRLVEEYMGGGGEHPPVIPFEDPKPVPPANKKIGTVNIASSDFLNVREAPSASSKILMKLYRGNTLVILGEAKNGVTKWLRVEYGGVTGWVAANYIII